MIHPYPPRLYSLTPELANQGSPLGLEAGIGGSDGWDWSPLDWPGNCCCRH